MNKTLNLLGIARRAKKLVLGTDNVLNALSSNKIKLILIANDASNTTIDKFEKKAYFYNIPIIKIFSTEQLSKALGVETIKIIGVADQGFAKSIEELERGDL